MNSKHIQQHTIADHVNHYFTSNYPNALYLEQDDRRFAVVEAPRTALPQATYDILDRWHRSGDAARQLLWILQRVKLTGFSPREAAPTTAAKIEMLESTRSELDQWVHTMAADPDRVLAVDGHVPPGDLWTWAI